MLFFLGVLGTKSVSMLNLRVSGLLETGLECMSVHQLITNSFSTGPIY